MKKRVLSVGLVQTTVEKDTTSTVEKTAERVREARPPRSQARVSPGAFRLRVFLPERRSRALSSSPSPSRAPRPRRWQRSPRKPAMSIVVPLFERRAAGVYHNSLVVIGPSGDVLGHYRKMHIPDDPLFYEKFYFTPGDLGFVAVRTPESVVGPLICWDQWYPEAARLTALRGAEILVYPTAIGWHPSEKAEYRRGAALGLADDSACARHCERRVRRRGESRRARGAEGRRARVLGTFVRRRSVRRRARRGGRGRRSARRRVRSRARRGSAAQLAVPARSAHRRVRRHWLAIARWLGTARPTPRPTLAATACPPSGSRTPRRGSPGRTRRAIGPVSFERFRG